MHVLCVETAINYQRAGVPTLGRFSLSTSIVWEVGMCNQITKCMEGGGVRWKIQSLELRDAHVSPWRQFQRLLVSSRPQSALASPPFSRQHKLPSPLPLLFHFIHRASRSPGVQHCPLSTLVVPFSFFSWYFLHQAFILLHSPSSLLLYPLLNTSTAVVLYLAQRYCPIILISLFVLFTFSSYANPDYCFC